MPCPRCGTALAPWQAVCAVCGFVVASPPRLRPLSGWATATALFVASAALAVLLFAFVPLVDVWAAHAEAGSGGSRPAAVADVVRLAVLVGLVLFHVGAVACLLVWLYRAYANLRAFPGVRPALPSWFAVGGWFVPFANLVLPPLVFADLARRSVAPGGPRLRWLVWLWWPVYLLAGVAVAVGAALVDLRGLAGVRAALADGDTVDAATAGRVFGAEVADLLPAASVYLVSAVLLLSLVHRVTAAQYDRFDLLRQPPPAPVVPVPREPVEPSAVPAAAPDATIGA